MRIAVAVTTVCYYQSERCPPSEIDVDCLDRQSAGHTSAVKKKDTIGRHLKICRTYPRRNFVVHSNCGDKPCARAA